MIPPPQPTLVLAHGAGAGQSHPWMRHVTTHFEAQGFRVVTFNFPYMAEGRKLPDKAPVLEAAFVRAWEAAARDARGPIFAAGKSMGGRMASMVAARAGFSPAPTGLVFFGYPLHPPGAPEKRRDGHLPDITVPMLFVHGERDPFGTPEEMTTLADRLPTATLHLVAKGDHSLVARRGTPVSPDVLDVAVTWMSGRAQLG
jgi:predicted alpha/beta-hydrolase family hydrolase